MQHQYRDDEEQERNLERMHVHVVIEDLVSPTGLARMRIVKFHGVLCPARAEAFQFVTDSLTFTPSYLNSAGVGAS